MATVFVNVVYGSFICVHVCGFLLGVERSRGGNGWGRQSVGDCWSSKTGQLINVLISADLTLLKLKTFCASWNVDALPCPHLNQSANYEMNFQYSNLNSPRIVPFLPSLIGPQFKAASCPTYNTTFNITIIAGEFVRWGCSWPHGGGADLADRWRHQGRQRWGR